jgi:hypothetical protein
MDNIGQDTPLDDTSTDDDDDVQIVQVVHKNHNSTKSSPSASTSNNKEKNKMDEISHHDLLPKECELDRCELSAMIQCLDLLDKERATCIAKIQTLNKRITQAMENKKKKRAREDDLPTDSNTREHKRKRNL